MRRLFADAMYWIAIANHKDQWHAKSVHVMRSLGQATLVTTEEVLDEFLTYYSGHGPVLRNNAAQTVLPRQESFASLHILTRRASEGSEALPSLARRVRMSFFGARVIEDALADPLVIVRPQSHQTFLDGLALYKSRPDKGYSLTDCISMEAMRQEGISEILTHDNHFTQEGFTILL